MEKPKKFTKTKKLTKAWKKWVASRKAKAARTKSEKVAAALLADNVQVFATGAPVEQHLQDLADIHIIPNWAAEAGDITIDEILDGNVTGEQVMDNAVNHVKRTKHMVVHGVKGIASGDTTEAMRLPRAMLANKRLTYEGLKRVWPRGKRIVDGVMTETPILSTVTQEVGGRVRKIEKK